MISFCRVLSIVFVLTSISYTSAQAAQVRRQSKQSSTDDPYIKYPPGVSTYGLDDGGCYFCTESQLSPGNTIPLVGSNLNEHCRKMCEASKECVAYTVGRAASLPAQRYQFDNESNCCLEKKKYSSDLFIDASKIKGNQNICKLDSMCWQRYEKKDINNNNIASTVGGGDSAMQNKKKINPIYPIADTYIRDGIHENTNYGTENILPVKTASQDYTRISLLSFTIPKSILKELVYGRYRAKLRLYTKLIGTDLKRTVSIAKITAPAFKLEETKTAWGDYEMIVNPSTLVITQSNVKTWVEVDINDFISTVDSGSDIMDNTITLALFIEARNGKHTSGNLVEFASRESGTKYSPHILFEDTSTILGNPPTPSPSGLCTRVWDEVSYNEDDLKEKVDYIKEGCEADNEEHRKLLEVAYNVCLDDIISESMAISIVKGTAGLYTHVSIDW